MDTNSIIISHYFAYQDIPFGTDNFITGFNEYFQKYTPNYILRNELRSALSDYDDKFRDIVLKNVNNNFILSHCSEWENCLHFVDWWLNSNDYIIDEGEKRCLSLSLYLSRINNSYIYLITDDFKVLSIMKEFMNLQRIGYVNTMFDVVLNIYARKDVIREEQVMMLLQEYKDIFTKLEGLINFESILDMIVILCRNKSIERRICRQECFVPMSSIFNDV